MPKPCAMPKLKSFAVKQPTYSVDVDKGAQKMTELILYISGKCFDKPTYGFTVLNKILKDSDFLYFRRYGKPITGQKYQKLENGPAPLAMVPLRDELLRNGDIAIITNEYYGKPQKRIIPQRKANLALFSPEEISVVDEVIERLCVMNATEVSVMSHGTDWKVRELKDLIPYEGAYLSNDPIDEHDIEKAKDLEKRFCKTD